MGSEDVAKRYKVKISTAPQENAPKSLSVTEDIVTADISKEDVLRGGDGILELNKSLVRRLGRGRDETFQIWVEYEITRARNDKRKEWADSSDDE